MPEFLGITDLNNTNNTVKPYITTRAKHYIAEQAARGRAVRLGAVKGGPVDQTDDPVYWDQYVTDFGYSDRILVFDEVVTTYNTTTLSLHLDCYLDNRAGDHDYSGWDTYNWELWSVAVFFANGELFGLFPRFYDGSLSSTGYGAGGGALYCRTYARVPVQMSFDFSLEDLPAASREAIVAGLSSGSGGGGGDPSEEIPRELIITTAARNYIASEAAEGRAVTIGYAKVGSASWSPDETADDLQVPIKTIADVHGGNAGDEVIHVTITDDSNDEYDVYEVGLFFANGQLFALCSSSNLIIKKVAGTNTRIYFDIAIADLAQADITFGDVNLENPPATTQVQGVVKLADLEALESFEDTPKVLTASNLNELFWRQITDNGGWLTGTIKLPGGLVGVFGTATVPPGNTGMKWFLPVGFKIGHTMTFLQPKESNRVSFAVTGWGRRYIRIKHDGNGVASCYVFTIGI